MPPATRAAHHIETTAESLQEYLTRLEIQKEALERELAAIVAHLGSVQRALSALTDLMTDSAAVDVLTGASEDADTDAATTTPRADATQKSRPTTRGRSGKPQAAKEPAVRPRAGKAGSYGRLTEQIMDYFARVAGDDVRARDVAAALGRDTDSGSVNAVRSTLDRLVGASRIERTGRGLYRAKS
ncbi:hypothetical protein EDD93_7598 [Streptomyces sp. 840.1]|uniref:hypothetical protein n=1 Tax=Streptomyces sp. 840.1 TaxID=2485152 RepID=UPI000F4869D2|nr:hypothetical protein [Streptomyces sp. 840.1]ROQ60171.1 hypothetical protein EDD93_7598 [Streptomyces sp. 840.1]